MFDTTVSIVLGLLPYLWQFVVGFLIGCWWYRRTLKTNPDRLQTLVTLVNNSGKYATTAYNKVTNVIDAVPQEKK